MYIIFIAVIALLISCSTIRHNNEIVSQSLGVDSLRMHSFRSDELHSILDLSQLLVTQDSGYIISATIDTNGMVVSNNITMYNIAHKKNSTTTHRTKQLQNMKKDSINTKVDASKKEISESKNAVQHNCNYQLFFILFLLLLIISIGLIFNKKIRSIV